MIEVELSNRSGRVVEEAAAVDLARRVLVAEGTAEGELGIAFVTVAEMRELKREHLGLDEATDVLAFPIDGNEALPPGEPRALGDVVLCPEIVGEAAAWLQDGMTVMLSTHDGVPIALELPRLLTLEITETEPAVKNQTASSSYKPATLSNGARIMVPPYIAAGTRVVVLTEDFSYHERAKD
jgi:hypothetical protein